MFWYRNNIVAIHAALIVSVFAWLWGGMRGPALVPVMPWLVALLAEVMLFFPQRHGPDESTFSARERVWSTMYRDPLVWVEIGFLILLLIPFFNNGLCPACDARAIAQGADSDPFVGFLPFCVNRLNHLSVFLWFLPTMTAVTAVKHALTKSGKRLFCEMVVWNAAVLAVLGFVQQVSGAPGPLWWDAGVALGKAYFFSTFGYPNAGGSFFASCFALSVGLWRWRVDVSYEERLEAKKRHVESSHSFFWRKHYMAIPTILTFFGAIDTLSRATIALVCCAAALLFVHAAVCTLARLRRAARVKAGAVMGLILIGLALFVMLFTPDSVRSELDTIQNSNEALDRFTSKNFYHARIALDLLWDHPLFGCGGWGYAHLSPTKMSEDDIKILKGIGKGTANVHNDYLQFLTEHGIVGFGCLVAIAVLLLIPACKTWSAMFRATRFMEKSKLPPKPHAIFVLPPGAFCVLVAALIIFIHAFADCPMRSPAVLSLFFCELAALDGFLPRTKSESDGER